MKIIVPYFTGGASDFRSVCLPDFLVEQHELLLVADHKMSFSGTTVVITDEAAGPEENPILPPDSGRALRALIKKGVVQDTESVFLCTPQVLERSLEWFDKADAKNRRNPEIPLISVAAVRNHPCSWQYLYEICVVDLPVLFEESHCLGAMQKRIVVSKLFPGPYKGFRMEPGNRFYSHVKTGCYDDPEAAILEGKGDAGSMRFVQEGDLCRREFYTGFDYDGEYRVIGCSSVFPEESICSLLVEESEGRRLCLNTRFVSRGDSIKVTPLMGNMLADEQERVLTYSGEEEEIHLVDNRERDWLGIKFKSLLPAASDICGYLVRVSKAGDGMTGDVEAYFLPEPSIWGRRIFPDSTHLFNLITHQMIQGRQEYPVVMRPTGQFAVGRCCDLEAIDVMKELAFVEIGLEKISREKQ